MQTTTDGIILRDKTLGSDDHIYTILTKERGVLTAFGRSRAKGSRSSSAAALELFTYSTFVLFESKERFTIDKADSNKVFFGIRGDLELFSLSSYLAELLLELAPHEESADDYLKLFLNSLAMLESRKRSPGFVKPLFEFRLMTMAGYMPDVVACAACGEWEKEQYSFLPNTGVLVCSDCLTQYTKEKQYPVTMGELAALRHILFSNPQQLFSFRLPEPSLKRLSFLAEQYIHSQLGKTFASLEFYRTIQDGLA